MSVEPINLQNLFLRSDQLSRDIAHQAQAGYLQQDEVAQKLVRQQQEQDARVHEIEKNEDETLKVNDDADSNTNADNEEQEEDGEGRPAPDSLSAKKTVSEDHLGQQIDICK